VSLAAEEEAVVAGIETAEESAEAGAAPVGPPVPFDPELQPAISAMTQTSGPAFTLEMIPAIRRAPSMFPVPTVEDMRRDGAFEVAERMVPGPAGAPDVSLLICRPTGVPNQVPCLYFIHGGGMMLGDNRSGGAATALDHAQSLGAALVSVEYRLAPETPHPGPVEDCYAGLTWTVEHADELGIDPQRLIVGGVSAGGGLAAAVALLARDRGGPRISGQLLLCPMLDDRNDTPSSHQMAGLGIWDRGANEVGWTALLGDARGGPDVSPYAAPARATDLSGLPPAFIDVGSAETFRDEDVAYATRIWQAGGDAELHVWPGGFHGFTGMVPDAALSKAAVAAQLTWLRRLLAA
jgi:acetyl esterase/lipase